MPGGIRKVTGERRLEKQMDEATASQIAWYLRRSMSGEIKYFSDPVNRYLRGLLEEAGEVAKACRRGDLVNIAEDIGDTAFMLALIAAYYGVEFDRALEASARKIVAKEHPIPEPVEMIR
jgi:NTP pyrophosphatase (non-canonical NTP hydrolase)